jgi:hypothetical protein
MFAGWPIISGEINMGTPTFYDITSTQFYRYTEGARIIVSEHIMPLVFLAAIAFIAFISIFLFSKRNIQTALAYLNYILIVCFNISLYKVWFDHIDVEEYPIDTLTTLSWVRLILSAVLLILNYLVIQGIKKDEDLIRSVDRIR